MQRGQDEVAGLRSGEGDFHRLAVAHLADEDDFRAPGASAARRPVAKSEKSLPNSRWLKVAAQMRVQVLDRVLERDHVDVLGLVQLVEHGRERGRLAVAGRAGDEDEAVLFLDDLLENGRQLQLLDGGDLRVQLAHDDGVIAVLPEDIDAKAGDAGHGIAGVAGAEFMKSW